MILLDTNVLSELMRPAPDPAVLRWLDGQPSDGLATTTVCVAELGAWAAEGVEVKRTKTGIAW